MRAALTFAFACLGATLGAGLTPPAARACGGLFCSSSPVDQSAERIVFTVREGHTDMVVQITYQGDDEDFAWILPLLEVPDPTKLSTVPLGALTALDAGSQPTFSLHPDCPPSSPPGRGRALGCGASDAETLSDVSGSFDGVDVFFEQEVGPFTAAAIGGDDPAELSQWLRDNHYNIAPSMDPYIALYTAEGMKFLALRLNANASVADIQPFKLRLPGESPGIPLRLTTLAAEPEMAISVWIFADQRFEPANADEIEVDTEQLRWEPFSNGQRNNYRALVARAIDERDGRAWAVDMAGDAELFLSGALGRTGDEEDDAALRDMIGKSTYGTRLYTRVSPEEMAYDPVFRRSKRDDVDQNRELPFVPSLCEPESAPPPARCHFAACGAFGLCREVEDPETQVSVAGCACAPGTTARRATAPDGTPMVSCQDERLSFLNPGDRVDENSPPMPDPCVNVDCGKHGACVPLNLTPTCACDEGFVALATSDLDGTPSVRCVKPSKAIPSAFYDLRPAKREASLPVGREVDLPARSGDMTNAEIMEVLAESEALPTESRASGCATRRAVRSHGPWLLALLGALMLSGRRRSAT